MAVFTITLGFVPARILAKSLEAYAATRNPSMSYRHFLVDQHYPVDKDANRAAIREICAAYGVEVLDPGKNLGLHLGFNWALEQIKPSDDDIIIAYDADSQPEAHGWDLALVRAIDGDPQRLIVWATLNNPRSMADLTARGWDPRVIDGFIKVMVTRTAVTNSVCAWRFGWLREVGLLTEPRPFYGHLEGAMWGQLRGKQWVFLTDWTENDHLRDMHDRSYTLYKWAHAHLYSWDGDFESWLAAGSPMPDEAPAVLP